MTAQKFFNSGDLDIDFWEAYISARPAPPDSFIKHIIDYHTGSREVAHDVGTGPGNIAERFTSYFDHVLGSDVNDQALAAAPYLIDKDIVAKMSFVQARAEQLADPGVVPAQVGIGKTDLIVVSECIPLLDTVTAIKAFHELLKPGGTLAIHFYGRPLFADGNKEECDALYDRILSKVCSIIGPFVGTPAEDFWKRSVVTLKSWLDSVELPSTDWTAVERVKWNNDVPLAFNNLSAYGFDVPVVDKRGEDDKTSEFIDRSNWQATFDINKIKGYLNGVYPQWRKKAGAGAADVDILLQELSTAMAGPRIVGFPVSMILARKLV